MKTSFKFLLIFTVVIGSGALIGTHQVHALCQGSTPDGHPTPLKIVHIGKELSSDQNTLSVTVLGVAGMGCNGETITPISITASIVDTLISKSLSVDDVAADFDLNVSSLANGTYVLRVRVTGGGSQTVNTPFTIERRPVRRVLPSGFDPGIAAYSEYRTKLNSSYSFSVAGGPASTTGDLYQKIGGVWRLQAGGWVQTDASGNANKGPWTCVSGRTDENIYIKWPGADENKTNEANHVCVGLPTASINTSPSSILRLTGPITISWSSSNNAEDCTGDIEGLGLALGTSGSIDVNSDLNIFYPPTGGTGEPGPITGTLDVTFRCTNISGSSAQASDSTTIFHDLIVFTPKVKPSCSAANSTAVDMSQADADNIRFETRIVGGKDYFNNKPTKLDNRTWSEINMTFKILHTGDVSTGGTPKDPRDISGQYAYCSDIGSFVFPQDNSTQYTTYPPIYFTPVCPGPRCTSPPPTINASAVGECHQNYPTPSVQSYISWNSVAGAVSYKVYWDQSILIPGATLIANTTALSYIHGNLSFNSSYRYYVEAINAGGNVIVQSPDVVTTTPASCVLPPPPPPGGGETLTITPSQQTITQGSTGTFDALYDPDGGSGARYGQWLANTFAGWSSQNGAIAQSLGNGSFSGVAPGSSLIYAWLPNTAPRASARIAASATLNVQSVVAPDFTLTAAPPLQTVEKPGTTSYAVSVTSLNGFGGVVALSVLNPPAGVTPSFNPATVTAAGNSILTLAVAAGALDGRSTVSVVGTSGAVRSFPVDITITSPPAALSCSVTANPTSGNAPLTVTATANGADGTPPYQYRFDWESDGTFDTAYGGNSAQTIYNSAGLYRVTTGVQDATSATATCTTQSTGDVTVNPPGPAQVDLKARPRGSGGPWHDNLSAGAAMTVPYDYAFNMAQVELSWSSQNVGSCTGSWVGEQEVGTSRAQNNPIVVDLAVPATVGETATHNLTITCNPTDTVPIEIIKASAPNCWLTASDNTIIWGQPVTLTWGCSDPSSVSDLKLVDGPGKSIVDPADPDGGQTKQKPKTTTSYFLKWKEGVAGVDVEVKVDVSVGFLPVLREIIPRW
jgi:hypothetical protein